MLRRQEEALGEAEFLLFCTGWDRYWGQPRYYEGFPCLTAEAAEYVASLGLKGVGEDSISLDPCDTTDYPNHMILLGAGLVNTENLTGLEALVGKTFTFLDPAAEMGARRRQQLPGYGPCSGRRKQDNGQTAIFTGTVAGELSFRR